MNLKLTKREEEICKYVIQGKKNIEIAKILNISSHTVKAYISQIIFHANVRNRTELAYLLGKNNYIFP